LRNAAMRQVETPLTLLLDADLYLHPRVLAKVAASVQSNERPFRILPCLYLSRRGSKKLICRKIDADALFSEYLNFKRASFLHLALPSSVTVFRTDDFERVGGFDCGFSGHGYEDFDFLIRLAWLHEQIPKSQDLLINNPTRSTLLSTGFRAHLARLALPELFDGNVAFHIWHATERDAYYDARSSNEISFKEKIAAQLLEKKFDCTPTFNYEFPLIDWWIDLCRQRNVDVLKYSVLFDNHPGHVDRFDTSLRRLKFLMGMY